MDRARAIYVHASAMADPRRDTGFWADWNAFEVVFFFMSGHAYKVQLCEILATNNAIDAIAVESSWQLLLAGQGLLTAQY